MVRNGRGAAEPASTTSKEKRIAEDGSAYTKQEFMAFYGSANGQRAWNSARPQDPPTKPKESPRRVKESPPQAAAKPVPSANEVVEKAAKEQPAEESKATAEPQEAEAPKEEAKPAEEPSAAEAPKEEAKPAAEPEAPKEEKAAAEELPAEESKAAAEPQKAEAPKEEAKPAEEPVADEAPKEEAKSAEEPAAAEAPKEEAKPAEEPDAPKEEKAAAEAEPVEESKTATEPQAAETPKEETKAAAAEPQDAEATKEEVHKSSEADPWRLAGDYVWRLPDECWESTLRLQAGGQWWHAAHRKSHARVPAHSRRDSAVSRRDSSQSVQIEQDRDAWESKTLQVRGVAPELKAMEAVQMVREATKKNEPALEDRIVWEMAELLGTWREVEGGHILLICNFCKWTCDHKSNSYQLLPNKKCKDAIEELVFSERVRVSYAVGTCPIAGSRRLELQLDQDAMSSSGVVAEGGLELHRLQGVLKSFGMAKVYREGRPSEDTDGLLDVDVEQALSPVRNVNTTSNETESDCIVS